MAKTTKAAVVAATTTATESRAEEPTTSSADEASGTSGAASEASTGNDLAEENATDAAASAEPTADASSAAGDTLANVESVESVEAETTAQPVETYGKPESAAEALALVKQFYPREEFSRALAELDATSHAAARSMAEAVNTAVVDQDFYRVVSPLTHNQKHYAPGKTVLLTAEEAEPLLGHTVVAI